MVIWISVFSHSEQTSTYNLQILSRAASEERLHGSHNLSNTFHFGWKYCKIARARSRQRTEKQEGWVGLSTTRSDD